MGCKEACISSWYQIKLKTSTDDRDEEIYMIQPAGFAVVILFQLIINLSEARLDALHVV